MVHGRREQECLDVAPVSYTHLDVYKRQGIERAVARVAGGQHAVEHVDAGIDAVGDVQGRAHAHEVAGLVLGLSLIHI